MISRQVFTTMVELVGQQITNVVSTEPHYNCWINCKYFDHTDTHIVSNCLNLYTYNLIINYTLNLFAF